MLWPSTIPWDPCIIGSFLSQFPIDVVFQKICGEVQDCTLSTSLHWHCYFFRPSKLNCMPANSLLWCQIWACDHSLPYCCWDNVFCNNLILLFTTVADFGQKYEFKHGFTFRLLFVAKGLTLEQLSLFWSPHCFLELYLEFNLANLDLPW